MHEEVFPLEEDRSFVEPSEFEKPPPLSPIYPRKIDREAYEYDATNDIYRRTRIAEMMFDPVKLISFISKVKPMLKMIGQIQPTDKFNVSEKKPEKVTPWTRISRTIFSSESRKSTIRYLNTAVKRGFEAVDAIDQCELPQIKKYHNKLLNYINDAYIGIVNLKITYSEDEDTLGKLNSILRYIDVNLERIRKNKMKILNSLPKPKKEKKEKKIIYDS